jgi:hypothetical protein
MLVLSEILIEAAVQVAVTSVSRRKTQIPVKNAKNPKYKFLSISLLDAVGRGFGS